MDLPTHQALRCRVHCSIQALLSLWCEVIGALCPLHEKSFSQRGYHLFHLEPRKRHTEQTGTSWCEVVIMMPMWKLSLSKVKGSTQNLGAANAGVLGLVFGFGSFWVQCFFLSHIYSHNIIHWESKHGIWKRALICINVKSYVLDKYTTSLFNLIVKSIKC